MSELATAVYELRRLVAALLGRADPLPGVVGPLAAGTVVTAVMVGAEVVRRMW